MKIKNFIKENKKLVILNIIVYVILIVVIIVTFMFNHSRFVVLNKALEQVGMSKYEENNTFVKSKTIEDMTDVLVEDVEVMVDDFVKKTNNNDVIEDIKVIAKNKDNLNEFEQVVKIETLLVDNLNEKNEQAIGKLDSQIKEIKSMNDAEKKVLDEINNKIKLLTTETKIDYFEIAKVYDDINVVNSDVNTLNKNVDTRIEKEKKEKEKKEKEKQEKEKKEAEEKRIKEEAEKSKKKSKSGGYSSTKSDSVMSGNFDRGIAMGIFNATNDYRSSLGLNPYIYSGEKQTCVDAEASAYASNKNPHNWVCDVSNENASYVGVNQNVVKISMDFFISDPPHEAVLSGDYDSAAVSCAVSGGYYHCILGVF